MKKRILFLGSLCQGGAEHQMVELATLLNERGYDVSYLAGPSDSFYEERLLSGGVELLRFKECNFLKLLKLHPFYVTLQVRNVLKKGHYDTIISFLGFWNYLNSRFAGSLISNHRAITGIRNNRDEVFLSMKDRYYTYFEKKTYLKVSNSASAKERFAAYYPQLSSKLITIYNLVNLPPVTINYVLRKDGKTHLIIPASYRYVKNPIGFLKGVSLMDEDSRALLHVDWYGSIQGGKDCYEAMNSYINETDLSDIIKLHDSTKNIADRMYEADVVGLFSNSEGMPNSICEGMMLGKPIIMTKVSDYELLAGRGNGFLCDADNPQDIARALTEMVKSKDECLLSMGQISKTIAQCHFSKEVVLDQWEKIIQ